MCYVYSSGRRLFLLKPLCGTIALHRKVNWRIRALEITLYRLGRQTLKTSALCCSHCV